MLIYIVKENESDRLKKAAKQEIEKRKRLSDKKSSRNTNN